jgi:hypothetical protein
LIEGVDFLQPTPIKSGSCGEYKQFIGDENESDEYILGI